MFTAAEPTDDRLVRKAIKHITSDIGGRLDVATLAWRYGVSERQLSQLFSEHTGLTPGRYVRRVRTEAAARLLSTTDLPVAEIAHRCGFGTAEALRQAFVKHYDLPPARYRVLMSASSPHVVGGGLSAAGGS